MTAITTTQNKQSPATQTAVEPSPLASASFTGRDNFTNLGQSNDNGVESLTQVVLGIKGNIPPPASGDDIKSLQRALNAVMPDLTPINVDGDYRPGGATSGRLKEFLLRENADRAKNGLHPLTHEESGFSSQVVAALAARDPKLIPADTDLHKSIAALDKVLSNSLILGAGARGPEAQEINRLLGLSGDKITQDTLNKASAVYGSPVERIGISVAEKILQQTYADSLK